MTNLQPIHRVKDKIVGFLSLPAIEKITILVIFFLCSTQLGLHFWPSSAFVYGVRVDYLSPTLYLLDILIIGYLFFKKNLSNLRTYDWRIIIPLLPVLFVNLLFSLNPISTLVWSLRLVLYCAFVFSVPKVIIHNSLSTILPIAMFFQIILGGAQTLLGHSLQGPLYWLGERNVSVSSPNVAKWEIVGQMTLRSYGTFSHPNILAGWLVVVCVVVIMLRSSQLTRIVSIVFTVLGIVFTQSRSAALAFFGFVIPLFVFKGLRVRIAYYVLLLTSLIYIVSYYPISLSDLSVSERIKLQETSLAVVVAHPFVGVGANASVAAYPVVAPHLRLLQPDHNSFTLLLSWFGLAGVSVLVYIFKNLSNWRILLPILPPLLLDHYFFTSMQGLFILLLYLRVASER